MEAGRQLQSSLLKAAINKTTRRGRTRAWHGAFVALTRAEACVHIAAILRAEVSALQEFCIE